jgi:MFS family permease
VTISVDHTVAPADASELLAPSQLSGIGVAALLCGAVLPFLDQFIVNVALPSINSTLKASPATLELTVAGYGTAYALFLIMGGRLGDAYGRRTVFITGLGGFMLSSLVSGLAPTSTCWSAPRSPRDARGR